MRTPRRAVAVLIDHDEREVAHEASGRGAMPVILAGLEEDAVARSHDLDLTATPLHQADTLGDVDGLAVRMRVPRRARAGCEAHAGGAHAKPGDRCRDLIDVDRTGEALPWTRCRGDGVPRD